MNPPRPAGGSNLLAACCPREAQRLPLPRSLPSRFARRPPAHAVAMSNKRAKMDTTIVMDEVDGFSAKELFGQGATPPHPPTVQTVPTCRRPSLLSPPTPPPPTPFPRRVLHVRRRHLPPRSHQLRRRRRRSRDQAHPNITIRTPIVSSPWTPVRLRRSSPPFFFATCAVFLAGAHPHSLASPPRPLPVQSPRRTWPSPWHPSVAPVSSTTT